MPVKTYQGKPIWDEKATTTLWNYLFNTGLNIFGKIYYARLFASAYRKILTFYHHALKEKECYYGPFKGEFGHFLLHNLPFLSHLYLKGVKIHYCGMALHKPFLVNEQGESIVHSYFELRDFFAEVQPSENQTIPPEDVQNEINRFIKMAENSGKPFLNISDHDMYWYVFRNWQLNGKQHTFNLSKVYKTKDENSVVIFPRKKAAPYTRNNGGPWNYLELAKIVSPYFDKVYITGHPSLSAEVSSEGNIEVCLSYDNSVILQKCSNSKLIITQHSGAVHIGAYTDTPVLIIFNGELPILGMSDTLRFRKNFQINYDFNFAFTKNEVEQFVKEKKYLKHA
jgi:hypothetical protein